jgi:hypothetical protein
MKDAMDMSPSRISLPSDCFTHAWQWKLQRVVGSTKSFEGCFRNAGCGEEEDVLSPWQMSFLDIWKLTSGFGRQLVNALQTESFM